MAYPWAAGAATGIGSLPDDDADEAARFVVGELPDFPHLPELPGRGAGSDMIGRAAALLVDLHVDLQPSGWRLVDRPGADERRAASMLQTDLDALEITAHGYSGPVKLQVAGPLTLAAAIQRPRGDRALADYGARRDLTQSLAEGVREHVADIRGRVPGAQVVAQVDEPSVPAVLAGRVSTSSGFGRLRAVEANEAEQLLAEIVGAAGEWAVVHCCAADVPVRLLQRAGAQAVSVDIGRLNGDALDELGEAVAGGLAIWPGVVPSTRPAQPLADRDLAGRVTSLLQRIDAYRPEVIETVVVTPTCGLARADRAWASEAYRLVRSTAKAVRESAEYRDACGFER